MGHRAICRGWNNPYAYGMSRSQIVNTIARNVDVRGIMSRYDLKVGIRRALNYHC